MKAPVKYTGKLTLTLTHTHSVQLWSEQEREGSAAAAHEGVQDLVILEEKREQFYISMSHALCPRFLS